MVKSSSNNKKFNFFISYYAGTGFIFAKYLKDHAKDIGNLTAFLDKEDIPRTITCAMPEWHSYINQAIKNSKNFILIMTRRFNERPEVIREFRYAVTERIPILLFKFKTLNNQDLYCNIDNQPIAFSSMHYTEFSDSCDLLSKVDEVLTGKNNVPDSIESKTITPDSDKISSDFQKSKMAMLPDGEEVNKIKLHNKTLDIIYKQAFKNAKEKFKDAVLSSFSVQICQYPTLNQTNDVIIYLHFHSSKTNKTLSFSLNDRESEVVFRPPIKTTSRRTRVFKELPWKKNPKWLEIFIQTYLKIGPFPKDAEMHYYSVGVDPSENGNNEWYFVFTDGFCGKNYRYLWTGNEKDEPKLLAID